MRKIDPSDVIDDFEAQIDGLESYFNRVTEALGDTNNEQSDLSLLAEQAFVSAAVALEGFFSDLIVGFVNRDSSALNTDVNSRFKQSTKEKFGTWLEGRCSVSIPQHPKVEDIQALLNPRGRNITFEDVADLKDKAAKWLAVAHRNKINGLSVHDERLINSVKAIRDFIAHRSVSAKQRMNSALAQIGGAGTSNNLLGRGVHEVHNVGSFLKAVIQQPTHRRFHKYIERMKAIAGSLR